ncbi:MAG TPA: glycosyltransferase 87 family protein [Vicinamibacteria bacterium]|nr:glycosyltransferase 87 family protein [Vicinamibacteria bacterium]
MAGAVLSACVLAWALQGDQTRRIGSHLAVYGIAFAAYLSALAAARGLTSRGLRVALAVAVLWRLALVAAPPLLSDDVNRSVWEGRVQLHGGNPYAWSDRPEADRWSHLRDEVWSGMNHRDYTAVYPPLWQLTCRAVAAVSDRVAAFKLFLATCELIALWPLASVLRRRGLPRERLLVLAWSPLALVEIAGSGHNEGLALLLLALSWAAVESGRSWASALAAAFGAQVKLVPALVAVSWARRYRWWHALGALATSALLFVPYLAATGEDLTRSLRSLSRYWRFNETLFAPLAATLGHDAAVRVGVLLAVALAIALASRRTDPAASGLAVAAAMLLLSPNVLPWYALWLLPFLVVRDEPAALLFTGTVALAYLVYPAWLAGEPWRLGWGWRALEYLPCVLVAALHRRHALPRTRPGLAG